MACGSYRYEFKRPHAFQSYVQSSTAENCIFKAKWTPNSLTVLQIQNKVPMSTLGVSLMERAVTLEDESGRASLTQLHYLENDCTIYNRLQQAMSEIHWHVRRNRDAAIMSGNFYFKLTPEL